MAEDPVAETWLLIDAAGPWNMIGLVRDGKWLCRSMNDGDFLAMLQPATDQLLKEAKLKLEDLAGAMYASGPGSTLGLRLATMFIRSLMEMPKLNHWRCLQYHNLELALWSIRDSGSSTAVAPWRRDRLHQVKWNSMEDPSFEHGYLSPADAESQQIPGIELGRRPPAFSNTINWLPYPIDDLPVLLAEHPQLLQLTESPTPYSAEEPEFARWDPQRHKKP